MRLFKCLRGVLQPRVPSTRWRPPHFVRPFIQLIPLACSESYHFHTQQIHRLLLRIRHNFAHLGLVRCVLKL